MVRASPATAIIKTLPVPSLAASPVVRMADSERKVPYISVTNLDTKMFVNPFSIQSKTSPSAYLKYIYDFALSSPNLNDDIYRYRTLRERRGDLVDFELSYKNLNEEVPP